MSDEAEKRDARFEAHRIAVGDWPAKPPHPESGICPSKARLYPSSYPFCGDAPKTYVYCDRAIGPDGRHLDGEPFHVGAHLERENNCQMQWGIGDETANAHIERRRVRA